MSEQNKNRPAQPAKSGASGANKQEGQRAVAPRGMPPGKPPEKAAAPTLGPVPPLFRRVDWLTAAVTTLVVFIGYWFTLAPQVTLEDSGELAVGSFYAGVPHPPGYPVWTIYTWLFTVLLPFKNIAWRVAVSSAVAGALSCGILGLIVSRGSSMMIESVAELKNLEKRIEAGLCVVSGTVAGMLLGFNGFMWSQSVIVEVYTFSVLSLMAVLVTLLRWIHAPHQRKYLYWCAFWFGICFTNHQTLIVAAMGIEVAVLAGSLALGRDLFAVNTIIWAIGAFAAAKGYSKVFEENPAIALIYHVVGVSSLVVTLVTWWKTTKIFTEWKTALFMGLLWFAGALFYFYMPLTSMTNPPMNWGYPRTEEGFWHALFRGQYDKTTPINQVGKMFSCAQMYVEGAVEEFNFVYLLIGLVPWLFFNRMQKRERAWMIGLVAIYIMLSALLLYLLNPQTDRQGREQARVFFTASHVVVSIAIGYGISLIGATLSLHYQRFRQIAVISAAVASALAFFAVFTSKSHDKLDIYNGVFALVLALAAVALFLLHREKVPMTILVGMFMLMPVYPMLAHWSDNEQRGHYYGYWFGHDMFTPPFGLYPEMTKDAVLFGGTDPGRFNPTYMIFCESFIDASKKPEDPKFDRRDVYLITQNALADGTYLNYIRAHYNRSAQVDPPFFVNFFRSQMEEVEGRTNAFARMWTPIDRFFTDYGAKVEARRRAEGVYPKTEIYCPSPRDSEIAFSNYIADASARLQHDMQYPNEPKKIRPGEDVKYMEGRVSVAGQTAVMSINGLLTKVIFDANPNHEFFVEESFPLDWMFPYLTPFGIIMKINHNLVPEFTQDMVNKDHEFWSKYSDRFIGNWITYDTSVKDICDFADKVYYRREYKDFKGHASFIRDDNAQKAFSKLRSAIGGVYAYRMSASQNPQERARVLKEAEFAFKQSFAFCPYSPEAVYKYVNLLVNNLGRPQDAQLVVDTCLKFDPDNPAMYGLKQNLEEIVKNHGMVTQAQATLVAAESRYRTNPGDLTVAFDLASVYLSLQRTNEANIIFEHLIQQPNASEATLLSVANAYSQLQNMPGLEATLSRLVKVIPDRPEAWYDLARAQAVMRKVPEALKSLRNAVILSNKRLATNANAKNLAAEAPSDPGFSSIRTLPDFTKALNPQEP